VKLLLDTHILLWWLFDDPKLPAPARAGIASAGNSCWVSAGSAWEIATKHRLGKLAEAGDVAQRLPEYLRRARFSPLAVTVEHAMAAGALPGSHRDPFDRLLAAQARAEGMTLVTVDPIFDSLGVPTLG
jgi:PIN domain nuclease of toxin-antitoxin system